MFCRVYAFTAKHFVENKKMQPAEFTSVAKQENICLIHQKICASPENFARAWLTGSRHIPCLVYPSNYNKRKVKNHIIKMYFIYISCSYMPWKLVKNNDIVKYS